MPSPPSLIARPRVLLLAAVILVAFNLRGPIAAVSPVLPDIRAALGMSGFVAGLLTALPVLCFALLAPAAAWLGRRVGPETAILLACLVLAAGTGWRVLGGTATLLAGTLVLGVAITVGNVLLPAVVKRDFAHRANTVTGLYTAALIAGASTTAALTAPLAAATGWRSALAWWAVLPVLAAVVWWFAVGRPGFRSAARPPVPAHGLGGGTVWRHPVAWAVALLFGFQSISYYSLTAWLPTLLVDELGVTLETAGFAMSVFQILGIAGTALVATLATWRPRQGWLAVLTASGFAVMLLGLLAWPEAWPVWSIIGGVAQGIGITLALTLIVLRAHDSEVAGRLSGMAQLVAYTMGALGPVVVGGLYEWSGGWTAPLLLLLAITGAVAGLGLVAGRDTTVGAAEVSGQSRHNGSSQVEDS